MDTPILGYKQECLDDATVIDGNEWQQTVQLYSGRNHMKPKPKTAGKFCEGFAQLWKSSFIPYFLEYSSSLQPSISRVCG